MKKRIVTILMLAVISAGTLGVTGCVIVPPHRHFSGYDRGHDRGHGHDRSHDHDHDHDRYRGR